MVGGVWELVTIGQTDAPFRQARDDYFKKVCKQAEGRCVHGKGGCRCRGRPLGWNAALVLGHFAGYAALALLLLGVLIALSGLTTGATGGRAREDDILLEPLASIPTASLPPLTWTIEPSSSPDAPLLRDHIVVRITSSVSGARWYKLERLATPDGREVITDAYYPLWFDHTERVVRFTPSWGQRSADVGPLYLRVSAWTEKESNGGRRVSQYSDVLAVHYDHRFERLAFDITAEVDPQRPGEAVLRAVPRDASLASQIELYAWWAYTVQGDDHEGLRIQGEGLLELTPTLTLRVSFGRPGVYYVGLHSAWNGTYGYTFATPATGLRTRSFPRVDGRFVPMALIVPYEDGTTEPLPPGFVGPRVVLPAIPGDVRFPLRKETITLFDGGSLFLPLGGAKPLTVEVQLPVGIVLVDYRPAHAPAFAYTVQDISDTVDDGSLPPGYRRYRLVKERPDRDWSYRNRVLPLHVRFASSDIIGREGLFMSLRAYVRAGDETRQDNWQQVRIRPVALPQGPLPRRLRTGITWAYGDLFPGEEATALRTYRRLGFNVVPFVATHHYDPAVWPHLYATPEERAAPEWEGLLYGPEHSTFYDGFHGKGIFSLLTWSVQEVLAFDFSPFDLTPEQEEVERQKWLNAVTYYADPEVTRIDLAYDGLFFHRDLGNLARVVETTRPDYVFIDSERFPTRAEWLTHVGKSANASARRLPGETDEALADRIAREFMEALVKTVHTVSADTKIALFGAVPAYDYGYQTFRWSVLQDLGIIPQPSLYKFQTRLDRFVQFVRLNRGALPPGYELIPWITTGTYGEMEPLRFFDVITHLFLNGATGFSLYSFDDFDDMADYLYIAEAVGLLAPYEDVILDGDLAFEDISEVQNAVVSAMRLNDEYLIAVTPRDPARPVTFTVQTREERQPHILKDLRHGTEQVYLSGVVRVTVTLEQGTVYRLVMVPEQCFRDIDAGAVMGGSDIGTVAAVIECRSYLPVVNVP